MSRSADTVQRPRNASRSTSKAPKPPGKTGRTEATAQFTLKMRKSLHRELALKALESDMTMRGFIMSALRRAGLSVTEADLVDGRRR